MAKKVPFFFFKKGYWFYFKEFTLSKHCQCLLLWQGGKDLATLPPSHSQDRHKLCHFCADVEVSLFFSFNVPFLPLLLPPSLPPFQSCRGEEGRIQSNSFYSHSHSSPESCRVAKSCSRPCFCSCNFWAIFGGQIVFLKKAILLAPCDCLIAAGPWNRVSCSCSYSCSCSLFRPS